MRLSEVIGHKRLTALISRAIDRDTLPPTLLFAGPSGVGKWAVAQATAQAVNCLEPVRNLREEPPSGTTARTFVGNLLPIDACGKCRACDRISRGVHVDVIALEPDERASIKIDLVRDLLATTGYRPFEGKRRAVLIREADTLEPAAQNSLLKSLEEPPPGTMFILTTAIPGALLPTVRSRCMRLRFGRLTASEVAAALVRDHGQSESEARVAAPLADGSIGQALALSDTDLTALGILRRSSCSRHRDALIPRHACRQRRTWSARRPRSAIAKSSPWCCGSQRRCCAISKPSTPALTSE